MSFITVLLGSSVGAALVTAGFQIWNSMRQGALQNIQDQLKGLYGPLFFFVSLNEALLNLYNKYHEAYSQEFAGKYPNKNSQQEAENILEEANSYINTELVQNNEKIMVLLEKCWYLIDSDDVEIFSQFQIDMARLKRIKDQTLRTAIITRKHIGSISYMRPEMIERVKDKWRLKRERLEQLTLGWRIFPRIKNFALGLCKHLR